jgi:hypothetical protein
MLHVRDPKRKDRRGEVKTVKWKKGKRIEGQKGTKNMAEESSFFRLFV